MIKFLAKQKLHLSFKNVLLVVFFSGLMNPAYSKLQQIPLHFDFGPNNSKVKSNAILVTEKTLYNKKNGFGLIESADQAFLLVDRSLKDEMTFDGIRSKKSIEFRVDINPGKYWVEIFMAGGSRSLWQGEIKANHILLADSIFQYGVNFEGEEPPVYWSLLRKVEVRKNSLVLSISSNNQINTLTGISIYDDRIGPIILKNGKLIVREELKAPNAELALKLVNKGAPAEAQRIIDQIPEEKYRFEKAMLLIALSGRLEVEDPRLYIDLAAKMLQQEYEKEKRPDIAFNLRMAQLYTEGDAYYKMGGWDWAKEYTDEGIFARLNIAGHKMKKIYEVTNHLLNHRAAFYLGRLSFHAWVEQHDKWQKIQADQCFGYLKPYYPDFQLLKIYMGEQILSESADTTAIYSEAPKWVSQTNLALNNLRDVIHYWVDYRQAENGEFGGKYDDDVEMLRWWPIARLALNDPKTLIGLRRLVDGVWNSGWITNGFSTKVRDVEHSSEPVADTQPMMIGLDYGNPIYVERCMESIKGLRDVWTGINKKGHRHFKSSWYSYNRIDTEPPKDCDVEMNTRTVKAARWLAWYNRHPYAMQFIKEWSDAWLEDCQRTDKGKPYGIVPSAIRYEDDAIGGHADNWHHPGMFWSYYNFHGGIRMLNQFLATYKLTDDKRYLEPVEEALKLVIKYYDQDVNSAEVGSEAWVAGILKRSSGFADTVELWRLLTGDPKYDNIFNNVGSDYLKYRLTGDKTYLEKGSKQVLTGIIYNRELITTEGYFTDRVEIGANHIESMYTGSALNEGFYPFFAVTWDGLNGDFVAVVKESNPTQVEIFAYNLNAESRSGSVFFWMLSPGTYEFQQGPDNNEDGVLDKVGTRDKFQVIARSASHAVTLPSRSMQLIRVRQIKPAKQSIPAALADLAIIDEEVRVEKSKNGNNVSIVFPVHNIGIVDATDIDVNIYSVQDKKEVLIDKKKIAKIEAPLDLEPRLATIKFQIEKSKLLSGELAIRIDPENHISEITEVNNQITLSP